MSGLQRAMQRRRSSCRGSPAWRWAIGCRRTSGSKTPATRSKGTVYASVFRLRFFSKICDCRLRLFSKICDCRLRWFCQICDCIFAQFWFFLFYLVDVDLLLILLDEVVRHVVGANRDRSRNGFTKMAVNRRPGYGLKTLDLSGRGNVEALKRSYLNKGSLRCLDSQVV